MSVQSGSQRGRSAAVEVEIGGAFPETLFADLEELGLNGSQARVLVALLQLGSANSSQIARLAQVPRTAVYPLLQELGAMRLAARIGSDGPAIWASPGRDEVLNRLDAAHEERSRQQRARSARVRATLEEIVPKVSAGSLPFVHVIPGPAQAREAYRQLLLGATSELLVLNRPPFSSPPGPVNPMVQDLLARGVPARVLFQLTKGEQTKLQRRKEVETYRQSGVDGRVVDRLPVKMVIADRRVVLVAIPDPNLPETRFPTSLLVENEDYAAIHVAAFESLWAGGAPLAG